MTGEPCHGSWSEEHRCASRGCAGAQVAMGFVRVANETMCRPIRALTQMKGYDVAQHCLACFGGAGGQHACAIAQNLGMRTIFVQRYAGVLSAVGIGLADVVAEEQVGTLLICFWGFRVKAHEIGCLHPWKRGERRHGGACAVRSHRVADNCLLDCRSPQHRSLMRTPFGSLKDIWTSCSGRL